MVWLNDFELMRRVNTELLASSSENEPLPFFCECAAAGCFVPVWLTPREFMRLVAAGERALASGHETTNPWTPTKRRRRAPARRRGRNRAPARVA